MYIGFENGRPDKEDVIFWNNLWLWSPVEIHGDQSVLELGPNFDAMPFWKQGYCYVGWTDMVIGLECWYF